MTYDTTPLPYGDSNRVDVGSANTNTAVEVVMGRRSFTITGHLLAGPNRHKKVTIGLTHRAAVAVAEAILRAEEEDQL